MHVTSRITPVACYMLQVPIGVPGRMWIAGPTLAIGYLNMPERTAERFVPDPFAEAAGRKGERMYDTGDRCRYLPSGSIEVIGRCDFMVKVSHVNEGLVVNAAGVFFVINLLI